MALGNICKIQCLSFLSEGITEGKLKLVLLFAKKEARKFPNFLLLFFLKSGYIEVRSLLNQNDAFALFGMIFKTFTDFLKCLCDNHTLCM